MHRYAVIRITFSDEHERNKHELRHISEYRLNNSNLPIK